jgi:hypothetical protein
MIKRATGGTGDWLMFDNMRGITPAGTDDKVLFANLSNSESDDSAIALSATGFQITGATTQVNNSGNTYIYIAIRRGPMKVPTTGTSVFAPVAITGNGASNRLISSNIVTDHIFSFDRAGGSHRAWSRLNGPTNGLRTSGTNELASEANTVTGFDSNVGFYIGSAPETNFNGASYIYEAFKRAPSVFDVVCYTGDGTEIRNINHNLAVIPEFIIVKSRSNATSWAATTQSLGDGRLIPNSSDAFEPATDGGRFSPANFTATTFRVGYDADVNQSGWTYVAYLFATLAGVSKVGSYTGTGTTQTINCGFTAGSRFVLIKRTDDTGDWYVWDSARGIVAGDDPHLSLNTTAAEVTTDDSVDTDSTGFVVNQVAATNVNVSSATYIFLAIA